MGNRRYIGKLNFPLFVTTNSSPNNNSSITSDKELKRRELINKKSNITKPVYRIFNTNVFYNTTNLW